ncbi:MAG: hypothetical protein KKB91_14125 [Proteobacteria bacterium]|jgi:hypothetical protein|nr:hypothetical protein [Desulfocapsa sp.]MBU3944190.1 hypothetical protein [Pseudomonadota bacterium]MCG2743599.1 hypothetical protein [Desulfobacteraceae bacterium]MBU3983700.1 hypothetical protein [Pseudomonadota bacterium]MBU4028791.1 hypothetical protein [Pseudomonadota bacterium]
MKIVQIILLAMVVALASTSMGMAAGSVQMNESVYVSANVKNTTSNALKAAVKLTAYDDAGTVVGKVCSEQYLRANSTKTVTFRWQAPNYKTGLYWSSKVVVAGTCINQVVGDDSDHHDDGDDSDDSDDDEDHDDDDDDSDDAVVVKVYGDSDDSGLEED